MKFEDKYKTVYVKDNSYNKKYDNLGFRLTESNVYYYRGYVVHRKDGPALEYKEGSKYWYKNGKAHREDGPAVIYDHGEGWYYLNNIRYSEDDYWNIINIKKKQNILNNVLQ